MKFISRLCLTLQLATTYILDENHIACALACLASVILGRVKRSALSFIQPTMSNLKLESTVGEWSGDVLLTPPPSSPPYFFCHIPGTNFSLTPAFRFHKIKDDGHNFRYENTEDSPAQMTPALQAIWSSNKVRNSKN